MKKNPAPVYVGMDVAKATLQVQFQTHQFQFPNNPDGHAQLCAKLRAVRRPHVVCEATGGYEQTAVQALHAARLPVSVVNPAQVRASAHAQGKRAKTDGLDCALLVDYGQRFQPKPTPAVTPLQSQLVQLSQWLTQLVQAQAVAKTQAEHHTNAFVRAQQLAHYQAQIQAVEAQIQKVVQQDRLLQQRVDCLDAIVGVGRRSAWLLLAHLPELGQLNRQEVGALAGLAPWPKDSGEIKGVRCISGGRCAVRRALYMPALCAARANPVLREFYQRLRGQNKPAKVALTAVMRKLVIHMNNELKKLTAQNTPKETPAGTKTKKLLAK